LAAPIVGVALLVGTCGPDALASALGQGTGAWPIWGNDQLADCTFAAAADWERADLGYTPDEATVEREYTEAGGGSNGIEPPRWEYWWRRHGIGGVHVRLREVPGEDVLTVDGPMLPWGAAARLQRLLSEYHYLLADMNWYGGHEILLDGYTAAGAEYVTFGEQQQMTWQEWRHDAWGLDVPSIVK
jgi:hypothetical protein